MIISDNSHNGNSYASVKMGSYERQGDVYANVKIQAQEQNEQMRNVKVSQFSSSEAPIMQAIPVSAPVVQPSSSQVRTARPLDESKLGESPLISNNNLPPVNNGSYLGAPIATEIYEGSTFSHLSYPDAFVLHVVLGIFGALHFRMGRYQIACIYLCTCGGFGLGYIIDYFRLASLVDEYNSKRGRLEGNESKSIILGDSYALWLLGFFGINQFYLGRATWGILYMCTCGIFGMGWLMDFFRMPFLVDKFIEARKQQSEGKMVDRDSEYILSDAYAMWFPPLGLFGAHHAYLGNRGRFALYFFTCGLFGLGWLVDGLRMSALIKEAVTNQNERLNSINHVRQARWA